MAIWIMDMAMESGANSKINQGNIENNNNIIKIMKIHWKRSGRQNDLEEQLPGTVEMENT